MKAVILAGGLETRLKPLVKYGSKVLLPVANRPLLEYHLRHLRKQGITEVILCANGNLEIISKAIADEHGRDLRLVFAEEKAPLGTAGSLGAVRSLLGSSPFLVVGSHVVLDLDVRDVMRFHREKRALATFVVAPMQEGLLFGERVDVREDGFVHNVVRYGPSHRPRREFHPLGVYLFEPEIFQFIESDAQYLDLKEQLYPRLKAAGLPVYAYRFDGYYRELRRIEDYFLLNCEVLRGRTNGCALGREIAQGIWVNEGVRIADSANLVGPIAVGARSVIGPRVQIIGPVSIGENCIVETEARLRECVIWPRTRVGRGSVVEYSILAGRGSLAPYSVIQHATVTKEGLRASNFHSLDDGFRFAPVTAGPPHTSLPWKASAAAKRLFDITGALLGITLTLPLMALIALAVKLDSPGPILFRHKRCGQGGREFTLLKFRSMVVNAEALKESLQDLNEMDGPVFKITRDPRLTRVGKWLRKSSLDELPQLFNVLKGEMSLVGPRPLAKEELRFNPSWWETRLRVKPGLTGLWQINGRSKTTFQDWIRYDTFYVENQSLWLDLRILLLTPFRVLTGSGAH